MLVDWTDDGSATLHLSCWQKISKAAKNEIPEIKLSDKEQELVKEAKKTAEFHDSEAQFQSEAVRIAEMLKNANYCIGFTGIYNSITCIYILYILYKLKTWNCIICRTVNFLSFSLNSVKKKMFRQF